MEALLVTYEGVQALSEGRGCISAKQYFKRLQKYGHIQDYHCISARRYDRIARERSGAEKSLVLIGMCCMLASKFHDDDVLLNSCWAKILGLSLEDVNTYEQWLLQELQYDLFASNDYVSSDPCANSLSGTDVF